MFYFVRSQPVVVFLMSLVVDEVLFYIGGGGGGGEKKEEKVESLDFSSPVTVFVFVQARLSLEM